MTAPKTLPGSFSGRMGRRWSREGSDHRARVESERLAHVDASPANAVLPPSTAALRRAIEANLCPFCSAGPYKSLGSHTAKAHGVSAAELRVMSGLDRVCSDRVSEEARTRLLGRPDRDDMCRKGGRLSPIGQGDPAWRQSLEDYQDQRRVERDRRDPIILERALAGHRLMDIAADLNVTVACVRDALVRLGVTPTLEQTQADRIRRLEEHRDRAKAASLETSSARRLARIARFNDLGGDWAAIKVLASELGISKEQARAYLKTAGATVPDGRKAPR
ncbi:hypothetical protein [Pimelobacter simplex]|uniref:hypothetical protein n=1 Tax=Nocardioides simplex TaxID=2045 RepID=UPI003AABDD15